LPAQLDALSATVAQRKATVAQLQGQRAKARKDSSTSSKPPSSDLVKPPKPQPPQDQGRRHSGGQPGHPKQERALFPPEPVNGGFPDHYLELCPACGHGLQGADCGACHASFSTVREFLRDVVQITISRGQLAKIIAKVSSALEQPYEELLDE
jgi:hypothetical protein